MSFTNEFNEGIIGKRRKGTWDDAFQSITITLPIINSKAILPEVPNRFEKVKVTGYSSPLYEIEDGEIKENLYKVDYTNGVVFFNSVHNNTNLTFSFLGEGEHFIPSEGIWVSYDDNKNIQTAKEKFESLDQDIVGQTNRINNLITSTPQPSEVVDMRVDRNGNVFTTAKERIDADQKKIEDTYIGADGRVYSSLKARVDHHEKRVNSNLTNHGISVLDPLFTLLDSPSKKYKVMADGVTDDTEALWAVHEYANENNLPVFYPPFTYYIGQPTKNILIKTSTNFGKAKFIIDEQYNTTNPRFQINSFISRITLADETNNLGGGVVTMDAAKKASILAKLKKKEYIIPELAEYKGNYLIVADDNDMIGLRQGSNSNDGFARTDMFIIEEGGRIIGDISQDFTNFTRMTIQTVEEDWLTIKGGSFYLKTGTNNDLLSSYVYSGFLIRRCKTRFEDIYVGFHEQGADVSLNENNGFINFSGVCDVEINKAHIVPRIYETENGTPQGTYGLGGRTVMNITFKNIRGEGTESYWGLFAPNIFKNFRVENCEINRIDTHWWLWNLHVKDCVIGNRGLSITGGGRLTIENTVVHGDRYIDFRRDYGAFWDGDIRIYNGTLYPYDETKDIHVLEYDQANFNHKNNTPIAKSIIVRDFLVDFRYMKNPFQHTEVVNGLDTTVVGKNILVYLPSFGKKSYGYRTQFPKNVVFENCRVTGANAVGFRYMSIMEPQNFQVYGGKGGSYINDRVTTNCDMIFKEIDTYDFGMVAAQESTKDSLNFLMYGNYDIAITEDMVIPNVLIENCGKVFVSIKSMPAILTIRQCEVNALDMLEGGSQRSNLIIEHSLLKPNIKQKYVNGFSGNGTTTTFNLSAPNLDATAVTAKVDGVDKVETTDFTVNRTTGSITFITAPATGTQNIVVTFYKTDQPYYITSKMSTFVNTLFGTPVVEGLTNMDVTHGIIFWDSSVRGTMIGCNPTSYLLTKYQDKYGKVLNPDFLAHIQNGAEDLSSTGSNRPFYPKGGYGSSRPATAPKNWQYFNWSTNKLNIFDGVNWRDTAGTIV
jgi:hypothetical protein